LAVECGNKVTYGEIIIECSFKPLSVCLLLTDSTDSDTSSYFQPRVKEWFLQSKGTAHVSKSTNILASIKQSGEAGRGGKVNPRTGYFPDMMSNAVLSEPADITEMAGHNVN
jgi:hypothetical protein